MNGLSSHPPDLICVTGDLCEQVEDVRLVAAVLASLTARVGTFVSLGNHEYNAPTPPGLAPGEAMASILYHVFADRLSRGPREADAIVRELHGAGFRVLRNKGQRLEVRGTGLWLGGVDSAWARRADVSAAMAGRDPDEGALLMIHEPEVAFPAVEHGADLVLAGHTHGGQVRLPFIGAMYTHRVDHRVRIAAGVQRIGDSVLHISAGLGQLIPLRLGCPPEAVWLHCQPTITAG